MFNQFVNSTQPKNFLLGRYLRYCRHRIGHSREEIAAIFQPDFGLEDVALWESGVTPPTRILDLLQSFYRIDRRKVLNLLAGVRGGHMITARMNQGNRLVGLLMRYFRSQMALSSAELVAQLKAQGLYVSIGKLENYENGEIEVPFYLMSHLAIEARCEQMLARWMNKLMNNARDESFAFDKWNHRVEQLLQNGIQQLQSAAELSVQRKHSDNR